MNGLRKVKIETVDIPTDSLVKKSMEKIDYNDAYGFVSFNSKVELNDIARAFFTSAPKWIVLLMQFRDKIGGFVGLKTMGEQNGLPDFINVKFLPGEKYGLFQILEHHPKEIIIGTDDKHLNFRVSLFLQDDVVEEGKKQVVISTIVNIHNAFGRFYFKLVQPFHKLIVPSMIRSIAGKVQYL